MELTAPTSIFRCMPGILPPGYRRLLGSFAYAVDGAELSYARLRKTALDYRLPMPATGWPARSRLGMFVDSWSLVDHVARARKLVSRFPWQDKSSGELNDFIRDTRAATQVRNRLNQLDDEIQAGSENGEAQAIVGILTWVDARMTQGQTRYAIASGPVADAETLVATPAYGIPAGADVTQFRLHVADQEVDLDALHLSIVQFAARLEKATISSVRQALADAAERRGVSIDDLSASGPFDTTVAIEFEAGAAQAHAVSEVIADTYEQRS